MAPKPQAINDDQPYMPDTSQESAIAIPQGTVQMAVSGIALPEAMVSELARQGIDRAQFAVRHVPHFWKVSWPELCTLRTRDERTLASPLCTVVEVAQFPDAPQAFDTYIGFIRAEMVTETGECLAITHSMYYSETGEKLPLTDFLTSRPTPYLIRFGYIETRQQNRHVVRPLPIDIDVVA